MVFQNRRTDDDFRAEIEAHIELEAARLMAEGMERDQAVAAARRAFGNVQRSREHFYESRRWAWFEHLKKDLLIASRQIRKSPLSALTVVVSLALGIGFNTAIFSLADQALFRALPVGHPEELVQLDWNGRFIGGGDGWGSLLTYPFYRDLRAENDVFSDVLASSSTGVHVALSGRSVPAMAGLVSGSYFKTLGVRAGIGRVLTEADDVHPGAHPVVVLANGYWRTRFGGDPSIIGKRILVNNYPMTVIGVAEAGFHGLDWSMVPGLWIPLAMKQQVDGQGDKLRNPRERFVHIFGRLKPGVSLEQAQARLQPWFSAYLEADTRRAGWPQTTPGQMREYLGSRLDLLPGANGQPHLGRLMDRPLRILLVTTAIILLLACLNAANLSLARALARRPATAMRVALGASRRRIMVEQLTESALLAGIGCAAGVLLAPIVNRAIIAVLPSFGAAGMALSPGLDLRVLFFALGVTALATILSGALPAMFAASTDPAGTLKQQSTSVAAGLGLRKILVAGQFALALILLIAAGAFLRTLTNLQARGPGYPTANLLMFRLDPTRDGYKTEDAMRLFQRVAAEIETNREIERVGIASWEMLTGGGWNNPVTVQASRRIVTDRSLPMNAVSPGFFRTLGAPITKGRDFDSRDAREDFRWDFRSAVVNEEFVKRYMPGANVIGAKIGIGDAPTTPLNIQVAGVVKNFQDVGLREAEPQVYVPLWEGLFGKATFYVRSRTATEATAAAIQAAVARIDPRVSVLALRSLDDQLDRMLITERLLARLAAVFAGVATLLAVLGLYGVLSYSAARRTKEIGLRVALGASAWAAGGVVVREAAVLALAGLAIAMPVSVALGRLIESQLYGVTASDPLTVGAAAVLLLVASLIAASAPARRASSIAPMQALRTD